MAHWQHVGGRQLRTLVTGGAGFIGSHITDLLLAEGHDVAVLDNLVTGRRRNVSAAARFYEVDIRTSELRTVLAMESPEVVFHQAAQMSVKVSTDRPIYDAEVNVIGLLNVLEACVTDRCAEGYLRFVWRDIRKSNLSAHE